MQGYLYLFAPVMCTLFNVVFVVFLLPKASASLVPVQYEEVEGTPGTCINDEDEDSCSSSSNYVVELNTTTEEGPVHAAQYDLSLLKMPHRDFKAYVRPDVATFYQNASGSMEPVSPAFSGQAGKFVNLTPDRLRLYWDSGRGRGHFTGMVNGFEATGTATFPNHKFFFGRGDDPNDALCSFVIQAGTTVYYCDPYSEDQSGPSRGLISTKRDAKDLDLYGKLMYEKHLDNIQFAEEYKAFTKGVEWLGMYPRGPPRHNIYSADYFGQEHRVKTKETQFVEMPPWEDLPHIQPKARKEYDAIPLEKYRSSSPVLDVTLKAVSCAPRVFEMKNFISHTEADHILMLANRTHELHRSTTGSGSGRPSDHDNTRTSLNTWVQRGESTIIDTIYRRVADVLQIDEALLRRRGPGEHPELGTRSSIAEQIQMVHYDVGQEYTAHHDFGYNKMTDMHQPSRSINVLLYLNDVEEGGETSFPRWLNAETKGALNVKPEKGKAVLFYMLLPDGNSDDLTQHAALPVIEGEKWMSNLWIWDPFMA